MREPLSVYTAASYPIAGAVSGLVVGGPLSWVWAASMALLGLATAWFHWTGGPPSSDADHATMNAVLVTLATGAVGAPVWMIVVGAVAAAGVVELWLDRPNRVLLAGLGWVAVCDAVASGHELLGFGGFALIGFAFAVWQVKTDRTHAVWHVLTGIGLALLWAGSVGGTP